MKLEIKSQKAEVEPEVKFSLNKDDDGDIEVVAEVGDLKYAIGFFNVDRNDKIKFSKYTLGDAKAYSLEKYFSVTVEGLEIN